MTSLEPPQIDQRTYKELLAEATARIPVHNPEWVNFNDADPGMTLLQLWAFMSENLLYQSSLIPERIRMKFFELLGVEPAAATPARGIVEIELLKGKLEMLTVPADREVLAGQVPFRTKNGLTAAPIEVRAFSKRRIDAEAGFDEQYALLYGSALQPGGSFDYYETTEVEWSSTRSIDLTTTVDGSLWLAVLARRPAEVEATRDVLGGQVLTIGVVPDVDLNSAVLRPGRQGRPDTESVLEFHLPDLTVPLPTSATGRVPTYRPVETRTDTNILIEPGVVELMLPSSTEMGMWTDMDPSDHGVGRFPPLLDGDDAERLVTWLRVRPASGTDDPGKQAARLTWVGVNAAMVEQRAHVARERIGTGTGLPDQRYKLANTPVLLDTIEIRVDGTAWTVVDDLMEAGPEVPTNRATASASGSSHLPSQVVRVIRATGEVLFGDGLHGARPKVGAHIIATYDSGGGRQGVVGTGSIAKAAFLPSGATVSNPLPTWGGDDGQTVAETERSVSSFVRHRDRMVAADDFDSVVRATPGVDLGRVEVLPLMHPDLPQQQMPGMVTLLLIPRHDPLSPDAPAPDQYFLRAVCEHIDQRRLLTTEVHLRGPVYVPVWASIGIDVLPGRSVGPVREEVKRTVRAFLSPLSGGHLGTGWPLLTPVNRLELLAVAARVDGVAKVFDVQLATTGGTPVDQVAMATNLHLPQLVGLGVRQGDPAPIADLQGVSEPAPAGLPVPIVPEECC